MLQRKEWEDLRAEIENIIKENNIVPADFDRYRESDG